MAEQEPKKEAEKCVKCCKATVDDLYVLRTWFVCIKCLPTMKDSEKAKAVTWTACDKCQDTLLARWGYPEDLESRRCEDCHVVYGQ